MAVACYVEKNLGSLLDAGSIENFRIWQNRNATCNNQLSPCLDETGAVRPIERINLEILSRLDSLHPAIEVSLPVLSLANGSGEHEENREKRNFELRTGLMPKLLSQCVKSGTENRDTGMPFGKLSGRRPLFFENTANVGNHYLEAMPSIGVIQ